MKTSTDPQTIREADLVNDEPAFSKPDTEIHQWLCRYDQYLGHFLNLTTKHRRRHLFFATRFLTSLFPSGKPDWLKLNGDVVAKFVRQDAEQRINSGRRTPAMAIRSLLRFLVAQGVISSGLEYAIPRYQVHRHASLPVHLTDDQISLTLKTCCTDTAIGLRNRAILLLLSRFGLRAKEVMSLRLEDVDWTEGKLKIRSSKSLRERTLPLPNDVGKALVNYLRSGRPRSASRVFFLKHTPPYDPFSTSGTISVIVQRALKRAGIKLTRMGAHVFRHTAATQMLRLGSSFKEIADVLGHKSIDTTAIYAKLDLAGLAEIALPWPGGVK